MMRRRLHHARTPRQDGELGFELSVGCEHAGAVCSRFVSVPDAVPDFLYLDGPAPADVPGWPQGKAVCAAEAKFGTIGTTGSYTPPKSPAKFKGGGVGPSPTYSYTAAVVEVDVDPETGWITVPRIFIAHDIGRALNPTLAIGQVEGSVYMGLGEALMEEQVFRRLPPRLSNAVVHKFPSILEYKSPTSLDMPEIITDLIEHPDPAGPFGGKEVGQGPLLPIMPAVANAVFDAVGARIDEVPITPEKILKALAAKASGKDARTGPGPFPEIAWPEPLLVTPPWEGGDGRASNEPARRSGRKVDAGIEATAGVKS